jgi:hypothetical protein
MRHPITREMIDIMMWLNNHTSSMDAFRWTTSWPTHCDWMILGLFTGYHRIGEYGQNNNFGFGKCARGARGNCSGEFMGTPLAACHPNLIFFDFFLNKVSHTNKLNCLGFFEIYF